MKGPKTNLTPHHPLTKSQTFAADDAEQACVGRHSAELAPNLAGTFRRRRIFIS